MNQDKNKKQRRRVTGSLEVPKPQAIHPKSVEAGFQEDLALNSMLHEFGQSKSDGQAFLRKARSRMATPNANQQTKSEEAILNDVVDPDSFFGLPSLLKPDSPQIDKELNVPPESRFSKVGVWVSVAAIMLATFASAWWVFGTQGIEYSATATNSPIENTNGTGSSSKTPLVSPVEPSNDVVVEQKARILPDGKRGSDAHLLTHGLTNIDSPNQFVAPPASTVEVLVPDGFWNLAIHLDETGTAKILVNKSELSAQFQADVADMVLGRISHEVARHAHYLTPVLNSQWNGAIEIKSPGFSERVRFDGIDQMQNVLVQMRKTIAGLEFEAVQTKPWFPSIDQIKFWASSDKDVPVVRQAIKKTDRILRKNLSMAYSGRRSNSKSFKNYRTMTSKEFSAYVFTGKLEIPGPHNAFPTEIVFQKLEPEILKLQLNSAVPEVDIFRDKQEFRQTQSFILNQTDVGRATYKAITLTREMDNVQKWINDNQSAARPEAVKRARSKVAKLSRDIVEYDTVARDLANQRALGLEKALDPIEPLAEILPHRPDLKGLDLVMGEDCHLDESGARTLDSVSKMAGRTLQAFDQFGTRDFSKHKDSRIKTIRSLIRKTASSVNAAQAIGTLDQMLQIERPELRMELVNALSQTISDRSCVLLTCYAKYDVNPEVRRLATDALRAYPADLYRGKLLEGFLYPWPEVAKHTAEAIVRLNDTESIPTLVRLLNTPDPRTPQPIEDGSFVQRELVGINHMRNCLLCHADSQSDSDPGVGLVPTLGTPLAREYYQGSNGGLRIRADVTYLRQDFSVVQPVENAAPWPENQRYDYVVRRTVLDAKEAKKRQARFNRQPNEYHIAIDKALRLLTEKNPPDDSYQSWRRIVADLPQ